MKQLLTLIGLLLIGSVTAQTAYIVDKKGEKTIVRNDALDIILIDKRISYKLPGKTWEKYIKFKDLDYAVIGPQLFKTFLRDKSKTDEGFFVQTEFNGKTLLCTVVERTTTSGTMSSTVIFYNIVVIDSKTNTTIEQLDFRDMKKDREARALAAPLVRKHFSDCPALMEQLNQFDHPDENNFEIMNFFNQHIYINCK